MDQFLEKLRNKINLNFDESRNCLLYTSDGTIMSVMHKEYKIHGVQFHPESIKTKYGLKILENFVKE